MTPDTLKELKSLIDLLQRGVSKSDFIASFKTVLEQVASLEKKLLERIDTKQEQGNASLQALKEKFQEAIDDAKAANETTFATVRQRAIESIDALFNRMRLNEKLNVALSDFAEKGKELEAKISEVPVIDVGQIAKDAAALIPPKVITAEEERDRLETLTGNDRLDKSAIKGIEEIEKAIQTAASTRVQTPAKSYQIRNKDCSSQCDGANKTFTVGGTHFGIIGVYGTQFPLIYRPIIDYTETATGFLLTSAVAAPESGQTLVAQFLK